MTRIVDTLDLTGNELRNAVTQNLASAPSSPKPGRQYYDTALIVMRYWNGSAWVDMGATGALSYGSPAALSIGASGSDGVATSVARSDHVHPMPSFGAATAQTSFGAAASNGVATTLARADHAHGTPAHADTQHAGIHLSALAAPTGDVAWGGHKLTSLGTPTAATDAASMGYVQDYVAGWIESRDPKQSVLTASNANVNVASPGASIGAVSPSTGDRIGLFGQTDASENGLYQYNGAASALTRTDDADTSAHLTTGARTFVEAGDLAGQVWTLITTGTITVGTTDQTWTASGIGATYTAGDGLDLTAGAFSAVAGTGIVVDGSGISINAAVVGRKFSADIGDGSANAIVVTHGLGTRDVSVSVRANASPYDIVYPTVEATSTDTVTVRFGADNTPATNEYRVTVVG